MHVKSSGEGTTGYVGLLHLKYTLHGSLAVMVTPAIIMGVHTPNLIKCQDSGNPFQQIGIFKLRSATMSAIKEKILWLLLAASYLCTVAIFICCKNRHLLGLLR